MNASMPTGPRAGSPRPLQSAVNVKSEIIALRPAAPRFGTYSGNSSLFWAGLTVNFVRGFQTTGLDARIWELFVYAFSAKPASRSIA